jgi:hypothetical protein
MAQFDMGSEKNQKTGGEKCYEFGWNPDPSNAVWAGPVSALRRVALSAYAADGIPKAYSKRPAVQWV